MAYAIILCEKCGRPVGVRIIEKTRTCAFCGARNRIDKVEKVQRMDTARQLAEALSKLKMTMKQ